MYLYPSVRERGGDTGQSSYRTGSSRFSERHCPKSIKQREIEKDYQHPLCTRTSHACVHTPHTTHMHADSSAQNFSSTRMIDMTVVISSWFPGSVIITILFLFFSNLLKCAQ